MNKPFHPFLFAIYPILFLYSQNRAEFSPDVIAGPVGVCAGLTLIMGVFLWVTSRNRLRSMFLLSVFLLLFFSYGHFYQFLESFHISSNPKIALIAYSFFFVSLMIFCYWKIREWQKATRFFNVLGLVLIAIPLFGSAPSFFHNAPEKKELTPGIRTQSTNDRPDIFYVILDGYPRQDVLQRIHRYDNSGFLEFLKKKNFRVLQNSHSNYPGTSLSLASSLNFAYLDEIVPTAELRTQNQWFLKELIGRNQTIEFLKKQGYVTAAFDSGYFQTEMKNVDHFYATGWVFNEFHEALLDTTPAWVLFKNIGRYEMQRRRILYILDHLPEIKDPSRPVFTFAHIMALHPPFVFGPNGEPRNAKKSSLKFWQDFREPTAQELSQQYQDQLTFINKKLQSAVDQILANRKRPVLIILQGDHGSSFVPPERELDFYRERFSILNAILLHQDNQLYDSMTPVNTFRVVFNSLFGTNLPLLQDRSFYSVRKRPFQWIEVTSRLDSGL